MDFSKMKFDISQLAPGEDVLDRFPELEDYDEFVDRNYDGVLRWVIYYVDDQSPFFKIHKSDFLQKGLSIYKHLKIDNDTLFSYINGERIENTKRIIIERMIFKFFILIDKENYNTWYSKWAFVQEMNAFLRLQIDPTDKMYEQKFTNKQKISASLAVEQRQLADYERQVFGDSKIKDIAVKEVAKLTNWPEKLAKVYPLTG